MKKLSYIVGGIALASVLIVPIVYYGLNQAGTANQSGKIALGPSIHTIAANAFGSLGTLSPGNTQTASAPTAVRESATVGATSAALAPVPLGAGGSGVSSFAVDSKMIMRPVWNYTYVYKGGDLPAISATMPVYMRVKGTSAAQELGSYLSQFHSGLADLSRLGGLQLRSAELSQPGTDGFSVSMNVYDGTLSINKNNGGWVMPAGCVNEACNPPQLAIRDVPSDESVIQIANNFLATYGINVANYGAPHVDNSWRTYYDTAVDKSTAWVPDTLSVTYPLIIDGQTVSDMSANPFGLTVNVSLRTKEGVGLWNLATAQYDKSDYAVEQDSTRILDIVKNGGVYGNMYGYGGSDVKQAEITVGTPTIGLVQQFQWANNENKELYVPAYIFPIENAPKDYYGQKTIVVPLPKDILDIFKRDANGGGPIIYMKGAAVPTPATEPVAPPVANPEKAVKNNTTVPVDTSELLPGGTSYLVCKSADTGATVYTTSFPYPPFSGSVYDDKGTMMKTSPATKDCVRTTKEYFDSKIVK